MWGRNEWLWATLLMVAVLYISAWSYLWQRRGALILLLAVGLLAEYAIVAAGLLSFTGTDHLPYWLIVLWLGFSAMSLVVFGWIGRRYWLGFIAGAVFGPVTYFAGVGLGAATLEASPWLVGASYSTMWALIMVLILYLIQRNREEPLHAN